MKIRYIFVFTGLFLLAGCGVQPFVQTSDRTQSTTSDSDADARGRARIHTDLAVNYLEMHFPETCRTREFRAGYERGHLYAQSFITGKKATGYWMFLHWRKPRRITA